MRFLAKVNVMVYWEDVVWVEFMATMIKGVCCMLFHLEYAGKKTECKSLI